jgi:hypothetical protein
MQIIQQLNIQLALIVQFPPAIDAAEPVSSEIGRHI